MSEEIKKAMKSVSLENLVKQFESTENREMCLAVATVRGWLMDEIKERNPEGFEAWIGEEWPEDKDLRKYVL